MIQNRQNKGQSDTTQVYRTPLLSYIQKQGGQMGAMGSEQGGRARGSDELETLPQRYLTRTPSISQKVCSLNEQFYPRIWHILSI